MCTYIAPQSCPNHYLNRINDAKKIVELLEHFGINTNAINVTCCATTASHQCFRISVRMRDKLLLGNFMPTSPPLNDETSSPSSIIPQHLLLLKLNHKLLFLPVHRRMQ
ncbi:hypothetical protein Y032_0102g3473 [Ancylostoma ceylanicum]|uniref:Uncharacterized protein n=1 Tax=Ancylostoma ceylanicum TaxID=53326 RepID=A0A016THM9_9BILA|nr:hypothetical protein Y032_0102g3473 [Ancylostoma ceylanicum]